MISTEKSLTPMMRQYFGIKEKHPDAILLYRMGDFFELFADDAVIAAKILGLTLTARNHGGEDKTPLAGFPHHAIERYMPKLIQAGYKVAVCEQIEDPATAKGVVKRDVVEVITRGTAINENYLDAKSNNYLAALQPGVPHFGLSYLDLSTGHFVATEGDLDACLHEIYRLGVQELLFPEHLSLPPALQEMRESERLLITLLPKGYFHLEDGRSLLCQHFGVQSLESFDCGHLSTGIQAAAAAMAYAREHKKSELKHLVKLTTHRFDGFMTLDASTVRNLELLKPLHSDDEIGTLFHLMDRTVTAMGGRNLKYWLTHPLLDLEEIHHRQECLQELLERSEALEELRSHLREINDIERLVGKIGSGRANARDLQGLGNSLIKASEAGKVLAELNTPLFRNVGQQLAQLEELGKGLLARISESPPLTVREGGMLRSEAFPELQELLDSTRSGREWLNGLQKRERERTGISTLKVGYNKVFGYYLEVGKAQQDKVPADYLRKQSLVNGERYITPEMKDWESRILNAESEINSLEYKLFCGIREELQEHTARFLECARLLAQVDTLCAFSICARQYRFTRPELHQGRSVEIIGGRHPVVEALTEEGAYISNDALLDGKDRQILLVTGPNMAGKSTYLRQVALISLLSQVGSFVPAESARMGLVDRIFTRVGAADRLAKGQSTFMVEMIETANILNNATPKSLVLLDEIGRGTSTYDGLSLAWAIVEALHENPRITALTMFATHYHELTDLAGRLPRLQNIQVSVQEAEGKVIFLRKIKEGGCDSSYGIQVARMAGLPEEVVARAWEILTDLDKHKVSTPRRVREKRVDYNPFQQDLFSSAPARENPVHKLAFEELSRLDLEKFTPVELMMAIHELKNKLKTEKI